MNPFQERLEALFANERLVSTDELAEALKVADTDYRTRTIRTRLKRIGFNAEMIGYQTWVSIK